MVTSHEVFATLMLQLFFKKKKIIMERKRSQHLHHEMHAAILILML
jgi:hypothetical protein